MNGVKCYTCLCLELSCESENMLTCSSPQYPVCLSKAKKNPTTSFEWFILPRLSVNDVWKKTKLWVGGFIMNFSLREKMTKDVGPKWKKAILFNIRTLKAKSQNVLVLLVTIKKLPLSSKSCWNSSLLQNNSLWAEDKKCPKWCSPFYPRHLNTIDGDLNA